MGTRYRGTVVERRALDTYIKLMRAAASVSARLDPRLTRYGLTESQFGVLETLLFVGPLSQREVSAKQLTSPSNMTTVVDNLERAGLITRKRDLEDRRKTTLRLTRRGRDLVSKIIPGHVAAIVGEFAVLAPAEQEELGRLCRKLGLRDGAPAARRRPAGGPRGRREGAPTPPRPA